MKILPSQHRDILDGGEGDDTIVGDGGGDQMHGWGGNDYITSQDSVNGNDSIWGGDGYDTAQIDGGGERYIDEDVENEVVIA